MPTVLILADDLTGAADACVTFVEHGLSGTVALDDARAGLADALAVSTDSRRLSPTEASRRVGAVIRRLPRAPGDTRFKKIDSTLRGHIAEELTAAMMAWSADRAVVAPAFPAMGRTMEDGMLRVRQGAARTAPVFGRLHASRANDVDREQGLSSLSALPTRLASQGVDGCRLLARRSGGLRPDAWADAAHEALDSGRVVVCDSACDADLDAIVDAAWPHRARLLWVGSAGLAGALARRVAPGPRRVPSAPAESSSARPAAVLFWMGSNQTVTLAQCRRLLSDGAIRLFCPTSTDADVLRRYLHARSHVLVEAGAAVPDDLLRECAEAAAGCDAAGFVMSGGYTAGRVCQLLGANRIDLRGQVSTGIPWGWLHARSGQCWPVVLKAGGFGGEDALVEALRFLAGRARRHGT